MTTKLGDAAIAVWKLVARYPALSAGLANALIVIGSYLGFNLTTAQLTTVAGVVATVFGVLVHMGVIPITKVANVKAGLVPTVGPVVLLANAESDAKAPDEIPRTPTVPNEPVAVPFATGPWKVATEPPVEVVTEAIVPLEGGRLPKPVTPSMRNE
jgi:hypothetical protein